MSGGLEAFLSMSGYATYVWSSFGLTFGVLLLNVWLARRAVAQAQRDARAAVDLNGAQRDARRRLEMAP